MSLHSRLEAAINWNTSPDELDVMSHDPNTQVRWRVARNPATPIPTLYRLIDDPNSLVREDVPLNPNAPAEILDRLSRDLDPIIRRRVARHPSTPFNALVRLTSDEHEWIRDRAWEAIEERGLVELLGAED